MKYLVVVSPEAQENLEAAYNYIAERSPMNAGNWLLCLYKQIADLKEFPRRFPLAREQTHMVDEVRQAVVKSYRIIFILDDASATVHIISIRHAKMRAINEPDGSEHDL